jgi:uncharacterized membrane protein
MIKTVWPYLAVLLLAAGAFPALERRTGWRVFEFLPPIVLTYLAAMLLAVCGLWTNSDPIREAQGAITAHALPALLFLLMVTCDVRAIIALGPRVLGVFACAMLTICIGIVLAALLFRGVLPPEAPKIFAALSATWVGGAANMVAVTESIGLSGSALSPALLTDAVCYSIWVVVLFSTAPLAHVFDRWSGAAARVDAARTLVEVDATPATPIVPATTAPIPGQILLWLGIALLVALGARAIAFALPPLAALTPMSIAVLVATLAGLVVARTPLARLPGSASIASALLAIVVAVMGSQSDLTGLASAPMFIVAGLVALAIHAALLAGAAKLFRFELALCGIASLAQIGGVASAPILAATYRPALVPVAILLALLGYILGTGVGLIMAPLLASLGG